MIASALGVFKAAQGFKPAGPGDDGGLKLKVGDGGETS